MSSERTIFELSLYKDEIIDHFVDFTNLIESGESISDHLVTVIDERTSLDHTATILIQSSVDNKGVNCRLAGGLLETSYIISIAITLNNGESYVQKLMMAVK